jgi:hypothetical protein
VVGKLGDSGVVASLNPWRERVIIDRWAFRYDDVVYAVLAEDFDRLGNQFACSPSAHVGQIGLIE